MVFEESRWPWFFLSIAFRICPFTIPLSAQCRKLTLEPLRRMERFMQATLAAAEELDREVVMTRIDRRDDVNPKEGLQEHGDVQFADPVNRKYPIDSEEHVRAAWSYIN